MIVIHLGIRDLYLSSAKYLEIINMHLSEKYIPFPFIVLRCLPPIVKNTLCIKCKYVSCVYKYPKFSIMKYYIRKKCFTKLKILFLKISTQCIKYLLKNSYSFFGMVQLHRNNGSRCKLKTQFRWRRKLCV